MDAILLQILNGLDKGGAYALIALGLTIIFGTLGVVNLTEILRRDLDCVIAVRGCDTHDRRAKGGRISVLTRDNRRLPPKPE